MVQAMDKNSELRRVFRNAHEWTNGKRGKPVIDIIEPAIRVGVVDLKSLAAIAGTEPRHLKRVLSADGGNRAYPVIAKIAAAAGEALAKLDASEQVAKSGQKAKDLRHR